MWTVYNFAIIQQSLHLESPHEEGKTFVTVVTCWQGQSRYLRTRNTLTSNHIKAETLILSNILRFYRHAIKTAQKNTGNRPVEEAKKVKCYKRLIYKKFFQISGLVAHSFWVICRNISRTFVELCMETPYWWTVLVHQCRRRKSTKTSAVYFFYKSSFFSLES